MATADEPASIELQQLATKGRGPDHEYCCIVGSYDPQGDSCGLPPCPYLGLCGPVPGRRSGSYDYVSYTGCDCSASRKTPLCEFGGACCTLPCCGCLICWAWPVLYCLGFAASGVCPGAVYAGNCCFGCGNCHGHDYDASHWQGGEDGRGDLDCRFTCCGKPWVKSCNGTA